MTTIFPLILCMILGLVLMWLAAPGLKTSAVVAAACVFVLGMMMVIVSGASLCIAA